MQSKSDIIVTHRPKAHVSSYVRRMHRVIKSYLQYLPSNQSALFLHLARVQIRRIQWYAFFISKLELCIAVALWDLVHDEESYDASPLLTASIIWKSFMIYK